MNQMFDLLKKEIGNVGVVNIRRVPRVKDGDAQDDIDLWELEAKERGIMFDDDSPENTKAPVTNTSVAKNIDLTRTNEIQARYNLAVQLKNECWELVGMSKQRLGSISASESATGTNAAITQSYSQTEPMFVAHEYVLGQLYQAILDASQYIEGKKPLSTLSYITSEGESAFVQVNGDDIKLRDLKIFPTNRAEDKKAFEEIRALAQPAMQNGASLHDVIELYSTNSMRQMKKVFKTIKERQEEMENTQLSQEQQGLEQQKQIADAQLAQAQEFEREKLAQEAYDKEQDRINKKEIAIIQSLGFGKVEGEDLNNNEIFDVLESDKLALDRETKAKDHNLKLMDMQNKTKQASQKMQIEKEKMELARENMKNDIAIAKLNAKSRAAKKPAAKKK